MTAFNLWPLGLFFLAATPLLAEEAFAIRAVPATPVSTANILNLSGTIEASATTEASFRTGGRVLSVAVDVGDIVEEGQELAVLDPTQQLEAQRIAQAALDATEANLANAEQSYTRAEGLRSSGTLTEAQLDAANEARISARAARDAALSDLEKAHQALTDTHIRAPRRAIITARAIEAGQVVAAAQAVLSLADPDGREASFLAPEHLNLEDLMAREVTLTLIETPSTQYKGVISEVSPIVDPNLGAVRLKAKIIPAEGAPIAPLGEGIQGSTELSHAPAISLPWQSITKTEAGPAVWRVTPEMTAELLPVTIERFTSNTVIVTASFSTDDLIVAEGAHRLYPGRPIRLLEGQAP